MVPEWKIKEILGIPYEKCIDQSLLYQIQTG